MQRLEVHRDQPAGHRGLELQQQRQRQVCLQCPDDPHRRAQHPRFCARAGGAWHLRKHRAIARCAAAEDAHVTCQPEHRGAHQRRAGRLAGIAERCRSPRDCPRHPRRRARAATSAAAFAGVTRSAQRLDLHLRIQRQQRIARGCHLAAPDIAHAEQRLAVQVGFLHHVRIYDQQPRRRRRRRGRAAPHSPGHRRRPPARARAPSRAWPSAPTSGSTDWRA